MFKFSRDPSRLFHLAFLSALALLATIPFFSFHRFIDGHDAENHYFFFHEFNRALHDGVYPRWSQNFSFGRGYPLFVFYPPLGYFLLELFFLISGNAISAINSAYIFATVLSALSMYLFASELLDPKSGLLAGVIYLNVPYRFIDLYVRAAFPESVLFCFYPLLLWSILKYAKTSRCIYLVSIACFTAACVLTHSALALVFLGFVILYAALACIRLKSFPPVLISIALGLGLSAFYLFPAWIEMAWIHASQYTVGKHNYIHHFLHPIQLVWSPWGHGYSSDDVQDGMCFELGSVASALALVSVLLLLSYRRQLDRTRAALMISFILLVFGTTLMTLQLSEPVWRRVELLQKLQFPWRLLALNAVGLSILGSLWLYLIRGKVGPQLSVSLSTLAILLLVASAWRFRDPVYIVPSDFSNDGCLEFQMRREIPIGLTKWAVLDPAHPLPRPAEVKWNPRDIIYKGDGVQVLEQSVRSHQIRLVLSSAEETTVTLNKHFYGGWKGELNGEPVELEFDKQEGLIQARIPPGKSALLVRYEPPFLHRISLIVSLVSAALLATLGLVTTRVSS